MKRVMFTMGAIMWLLYVLLLTGCRVGQGGSADDKQGSVKAGEGAGEAHGGADNDAKVH